MLEILGPDAVAEEAAAEEVVGFRLELDDPAGNEEV